MQSLQTSLQREKGHAALFFFFIGVELIYNIELVSAVQPSELAI